MQMHGGTVSAHLSRLARLGWKGMKEPSTPDPSAQIEHELGYLIDWYERLRRQTPRGFDRNPLLYTEIEAFDRLYDHRMDAFDIDTLEKLDLVWQSCLPKKS